MTPFVLAMLSGIWIAEFANMDQCEAFVSQVPGAYCRTWNAPKR